MPINWPYWGLNEPDETTSACMRAQMATGVLFSFKDNDCGNKEVNCILCDAKRILAIELNAV